MPNKFTLIFLLLNLILPVVAHAYPEKALVPGGIALLAMPDYKEGTAVTFDNKPIAIFPYKDTWVAMAGIPLDAKPGDYEFSIKHHTLVKSQLASANVLNIFIFVVLIPCPSPLVFLPDVSVSQKQLVTVLL